MADSFELKPSDKSASTTVAVPPSTSEITIRTMASDVELMGKSGGMAGPNISLAQVQHVAVSAPQEAPVMSSTGVPAAHPTAPDPSSTRAIIWVILILAVGGGLFAIGFYLYPLFVK